ncbi:MAG: TolC family protein [Hyphomonadaceae bacterium]
MSAAPSLWFTRKSGALAFALVLGCTVRPPTAAAQDFLPPLEVVENVLNADPQVKAGLERVGQSRGEARRLEAGPHEWTMSGSYHRRDVEDGMLSFGEYDATISRGLRLPGKGRLDREIGAALIKSAEQYAEDARHQTALSLMERWMAWLAASETVTARRELETAFAEEVRIVTRRAAVDDAAEIEVELARAAHAASQVATRQAEGEEARARAELEAFFPDLPLPAAAPPIDRPPVLSEPETWVERTIARSHEIGFYQAEANRLEASARRARADRTPDPSLGVRAFSERNGEETGLGLVLTVPLGGGARMGTASKEAAAAREALQMLEKRKREIRSLARTNVIMATSEQEAWAAARSALDDSEAAVRRMRRGFELQAYDLADLQAAERRFGEARLLEIEARVRATIAWLTLQIDAHELWLEAD